MNPLGELEERLGQLKAWQQENERNIAAAREHSEQIEAQKREICIPGALKS